VVSSAAHYTEAKTRRAISAVSAAAAAAADSVTACYRMIDRLLRARVPRVDFLFDAAVAAVTVRPFCPREKRFLRRRPADMS